MLKTKANVTYDMESMTVINEKDIIDFFRLQTQ